MNLRKTAIPVFSVAVALWATTSLALDHTKDSLENVKKNVEDKKAVLVDVRSKAEWDEGHLENAIFLPLTDLQKGVDPKTLEKQLPKDKVIYTHCVVGKRSLAAGKILKDKGYDVRPLKAGYEELVKSGFKPAKKS